VICDIFTPIWRVPESITFGGKLCQRKFRKLLNLARLSLGNICANLINILNKIIYSQEFLYRYRKSKTNFNRKPILTFPTLIVFMMNLLKGSIQDELKRFFQALESKDVPDKEITAGAFTRARKKLSFNAFIELNRIMVNYFYKYFPQKKWNGLRLVAIDGSTVKVPRTEETIKHFGRWKTRNGNDRPLARISQLLDVLNGVIIDAIISPKKTGERQLAIQHLDHLGEGDLLLCDRGYPAFWLFALLLSRKIHFCIRVTTGHWNEICKFNSSGKIEDIVVFNPTITSWRDCQKRGIPVSPLPLRLIRVELPSGEVEILVTSLLDMKEFPHEIFKDLYANRWPIEEKYKTVKCRIQIENFSGKSVEAIYQDFYAKLFTLNLTAALIHPVQEMAKTEYQNRKFKYHVNLSQSLSKMKHTVAILFNRPNCEIEGIINKLFKLFLDSVLPGRPGRKSPRKKGPKLQGYHMPYKQLA
jgi:hypothetical protein